MNALRIINYGRYFAVYEGEELIAVTVYKRGAIEIVRRLQQAWTARYGQEAA